jgi:hypothetical protein
MLTESELATIAEIPLHDVPHLIAEIRALRAALMQYGAHTGMCGYQGPPYPYGYRCVCGLYDVIDAGEHLAALDDRAPRETQGD